METLEGEVVDDDGEEVGGGNRTRDPLDLMAHIRQSGWLTQDSHNGTYKTVNGTYKTVKRAWHM